MLSFETFDDLSQYVRQILCGQADLDLMTPMMETPIQRKGDLCGLEYLVLGPRSVRLSAVWDADTNRVLFYDQSLKRFHISAIQGPDKTAYQPQATPDVRIKSLWKGK